MIFVIFARIVYVETMMKSFVNGIGRALCVALVALGSVIGVRAEHAVPYHDADVAACCLMARLDTMLTTTDSTLFFTLCDSLRRLGEQLDNPYYAHDRYYDFLVHYELGRGRTGEAKRVFERMCSQRTTDLSHWKGPRGIAHLNVSQVRVEQRHRSCEVLYETWKDLAVSLTTIDNDYIAAQEECDAMLAYATLHDEDEGLAFAYYAIGSCLFFSRSLVIENFERALGLFRDLDCKEHSHVMYGKLAVNYWLGQKWEEAARYAKLIADECTGADYDAYLANCSDVVLLDYAIHHDMSAESVALFERLDDRYRAGDTEGWNLPYWGLAAVNYLCRYGQIERTPDYIALTVPDRILYLESCRVYYSSIGRKDIALNYADSLRMCMVDLSARVKVARGENTSAMISAQMLKRESMQLIKEKNESQQRRNHAVVAALALLLVVAGGVVFASRRYSRKLNRERDKAVRLGEMKSTFINNLSQQVRTPLNAIIGCNNVLNNSGLDFAPEDRLELVNSIEEHTLLIEKLLDHIVYLGRLDGNDVKPTVEIFTLATVARVAVEAVQNKLQPGVVIDAESVLRSTEVIESDRKIVENALIAVLDNAAKYTTSGTIRMTFEGHALAITDTGKGIPAEASEVIFERFERLDHTDVCFGLDLSIARESLAQVGAKIYLDTAYTQPGARFVIEFPEVFTPPYNPFR